MDMNASKSGGGFVGGGGAMDTQKQKKIDECSSFEKGTPEYTACQARLKEMQFQQERKNNSVKGGSIYDPDNLLATKNPNDHRGYKVDGNGKVVFQNPL